MQSIEGFDFFPLSFNRDGNLEQPGQFDELREHVQTSGATEAIFLAHGFRNSAIDATGLYTNFLKTFRVHMSRPELRDKLAGRKFAVAGVYWPSLAFQETFGTGEGSVMSADPSLAQMEAARAQLEQLKQTEASPELKSKLDEASKLLPRVETDPDAQDKFVTLVLSLLKDGDSDPTEGLPQIRSKPGSELFEKLSTPIILPTKRADSDGGAMGMGEMFIPGGDGGAQSFGSLVSSAAGRVGQFLNFTTWYVMKERSGTVGGNGVAKAVRDLKTAKPTLKIHLVGHSLGGRLMAACAKSLAQPPKVQPDSLTLLEAAFSHYGFSDNNGQGTPGFFRAVIDNKVVKGPFVATFSYQDTVVGQAYAISSRLAGDNVKAIGDANDPFGGIGRNGAQKTAESAVAAFHAPGSVYTFKPGVVNCIDGSGGFIKDHGDVTNENVTYVFASAVAAT